MEKEEELAYCNKRIQTTPGISGSLMFWVLKNNIEIRPKIEEKIKK